MAWLSAGLAVGYVLAQHVGIGVCDDDRCCGAAHGHSPEKPPLRVKPVPIVKKTVATNYEEENGADDTPEEDTE